MYKKRRTTKKGSRGWEISESEQDWPAWKILYVWLKTDANEELKANLYGEAHKEEEKKIIFVFLLQMSSVSSFCPVFVWRALAWWFNMDVVGY